MFKDRAMLANTQAGPPRTAWKGASHDETVASFRYRIAAPIEMLTTRGHAVELFDAAQADTYDTVVFSKAYGRADRALAEAVIARGGRVVFDLCDNHFYNPLDLPRYRRARDDLLAMLEIADRVICTTPALAEVIVAETGGRSRPLVVSDAPERMPRDACPRDPSGPLKLLWFGSHGSPNAPSGMADLGLIRTRLESMGDRVELTVCSNNRAKFEAEIAPMRLPTRYAEWSARRYAEVMAQADAVVLPVTLNPFTNCKSHNRLTSALGAGLPTLATGIEAYREFAPYSRLDDWDAGLAALVEDYAGERARAARARAYIDDVWSTEVVADQWERALELQNQRARASRQSVGPDGRKTPMICQGHLDADPGERVSGWVRLPARPRSRLSVVIERDGVAVARGVADLARPDLEAAGMPSPDCGFSLAAKPENGVTLRVRVVDPDWLIGEVSGQPPAWGSDRAVTTPPVIDRSSIEADMAHQARLQDGVRVIGEAMGDIRRLLARAVLEGAADLGGASDDPTRPVSVKAAKG